MQPEAFRGVFVILPTPFDERGNLDEEGLAGIVDFSIECGSRGVVGPANASEAPYLSDAERKRVVEITAKATAGRVPYVAGVTASCAKLAVELTRQAADAGADMVMAMPPFIQRASDAEIREYFRVIGEASPLPVCIQNYQGPGGTPLSAAFIASMLKDLKGVHYVKEETDFPGPMVSALREIGGPHLKGVMGGKAGRHLLDEFRRGVCGTMPACEVADLHARLWNELETGKADAARDTYTRLLPLLLFETSYGVAVYKEVLRRRGVIKSAYHRQAGGRQLDAGARDELGAILAALAPLMSPKYPLVS
jgi:dihydrodipicolinate synthase/N-acetylneuraminate lyase